MLVRIVELYHAGLAVQCTYASETTPPCGHLQGITPSTSLHKEFFDKIQPMLKKKQLVGALDKYDSFGTGVRQSDFYRWIHEQKDWENEDIGVISKTLEDCIDDEWIGRRIQQEIDTTRVQVRSWDPINVNTINDLPTRGVGYIYVRSRGREITKWHFFIPAFLKKMSLWEIIMLGLATGLTIVAAIVLAKLNIKQPQ
jgi:hypothetical protein